MFINKFLHLEICGFVTLGSPWGEEHVLHVLMYPMHMPVSQGATVYAAYASLCLLFVQALHSNCMCDLDFIVALGSSCLDYLADWI